MSDPGIGILLFVANRAMEKRAYDAVVAAGHDDITLSQSRILARIGPDGTRIGELAEAARVTKQTATHLVDELVSAGYVERVPDPTDGRARLVRMTAKARRVLPKAGAEVERVEAEWRDHLGTRDYDSLVRILGRLREITDPWA